MVPPRVYTVEATAIEPLHSGESNVLSGADNPIALAGGRVCIPGPSLKGAYRANVERWLVTEFLARKGKWEPPSLQPCIPTTQKHLSAEERDLIGPSRAFRGTGCTYGMKGSSTVCPVCYFAGAMGLVGFVHFPFLFAKDELETLHAVGLDRTRYAVRDGTNRAYQFVPPGTAFTGELEVLVQDDLLGWQLGKPRPLKENPDADKWLKDDATWNKDRVLKEMIVDRLESVDRLGGYRSKGFGKVKIRVTERT